MDNFILATFCTAVEYGITYWAYVTKYVYDDDYPEGAFAILEVRDDDCTVITATPAHVRRGLEAIAAAEGPFYEPNFARTQHATIPFLTAGVARRVREALADPENAALDAGDADDVLQVGLFGEVVYG
jgi:hypothetical protein